MAQSYGRCHQPQGEQGIRPDLRYGNGTETFFKPLQSNIALFLSLFLKRVPSPREAETERTGISSKIRTYFAAHTTLRSSTPVREDGEETGTWLVGPAPEGVEADRGPPGSFSPLEGNGQAAHRLTNRSGCSHDLPVPDTTEH